MASLQIQRAAGVDAQPAPSLRQIVEKAAMASPDVEVLRSKRSNVQTARAATEDGASIIVKLWRFHGWRGLAQRIAGRSGAQREWRALHVLRAAGAPVPEPIARYTLRRAPTGLTQALVIEDLGPCERMSERFKRLLQEPDSPELARLERAVAAINAQMMRLGVVDMDNAVMNYLITSSGEVRRVDLEHAHMGPLARASADAKGAMLGQLIATYAFVAHPDASRANRLTRLLVEMIHPGARVMRSAQRHVDQLLARQRAERGIDATLRLEA